jgi:sialate O-acetylesterase
MLRLLLVVCGLACIVPARADVVPAACFGSHMVLQRGLPLPVWGTAAPGERVSVSFGGGAATAVADAEGRWRVTLAPQAASDEPRALVIRGANEVRCDDVLVGEVFLCAGQSNMLLPLARADDARREIAAANRPRLRLFTVRTAAGGDPPAYTSAQIRDLVPARFCTGAWEACTPEGVRSFSAAGYFLGAAVGDELDVPVGIVCAAVGGARRPIPPTLRAGTPTSNHAVSRGSPQPDQERIRP